MGTPIYFIFLSALDPVHQHLRRDIEIGAL